MNMCAWIVAMFLKNYDRCVMRTLQSFVKTARASIPRASWPSSLLRAAGRWWRAAPLAAALAVLVDHARRAGISIFSRSALINPQKYLAGGADSLLLYI
jgi:hypothetical protein